MLSILKFSFAQRPTICKILVGVLVLTPRRPFEASKKRLYVPVPLTSKSESYLS